MVRATIQALYDDHLVRIEDRFRARGPCRWDQDETAGHSDHLMSERKTVRLAGWLLGSPEHLYLRWRYLVRIGK